MYAYYVNGFMMKNWVTPTRGIAPGTKFADLPDDWECPECFAGKDEFELIEFGD